MPLYEYACRRCNHRFEELVFAGEDEPEACPACSHVGVQRVLSVPGNPRTKAALPVGGACQASGAPCGPACARFAAN
jgi:putative FmdB family regulatory protein